MLHSPWWNEPAGLQMSAKSHPKRPNWHTMRENKPPKRVPKWERQTRTSPTVQSSEPRVLMTTFWPISCPKTCRVRSHVSTQRLNFGTMWPRVGPTLEATSAFGCQVRCWDSPDRSTNQSISRSIDQSNQWSQSIN